MVCSAFLYCSMMVPVSSNQKHARHSHRSSSNSTSRCTLHGTLNVAHHDCHVPSSGPCNLDGWSCDITAAGTCAAVCDLRAAGGSLGSSRQPQRSRHLCKARTRAMLTPCPPFPPLQADWLPCACVHAVPDGQVQGGAQPQRHMGQPGQQHSRSRGECGGVLSVPDRHSSRVFHSVVSGECVERVMLPGVPDRHSSCVAQSATMSAQLCLSVQATGGAVKGGRCHILRL